MTVIKTLCSLFIFVALALGCGPLDLGQNGHVRFADETNEPGFAIRFGIQRDIAKGATLNVVISEPIGNVSRVHSNDTTILTIQDIQPIENANENETPSVRTRITVQAEQVGTTRLNVDLEDGRTDYIDLTVAAAQTNEMELYPWHDHIALDPSLWSKGISLLPNTNMTVFGRARGIDGRALTGAKSEEWHLDTEGNARIEPKEDSDFAVYNSGSMVGMNGLKFGQSARRALATIAPSAVDRIEIIFPYGDPNNVKVDEMLILHAAFFTSEGVYVVGIGDESVRFHTSSGPLPGPEDLVDDETSPNEYETIERAYEVGRAAHFTSEEVGVHTVVASWGGLEASVDIEVRPRSQNQ